MKKAHLFSIITSLLLVCAMTVNFTGCAVKEPQAENLSANFTAETINTSADFDSLNQSAADFAVRLFKASNKDGENTLISPFSVMCALAMTANGAENETLSEMESALGISAENLNKYIYTYMRKIFRRTKNAN